MIQLSAFSDEAAESLSEQIAALHRNEIAYTELRGIDGKNVKDFTASQAREYRKVLDGGGISVYSIGSPLGKEDISVNFDEYSEVVKHVCELANIFGTNRIRMFSFYNAYGEKNKVFDYLQKMVDIAELFGVTLCHENEKEIYGDTLARISEIKQNVKGLKYVYDPANFLQVGEKADDTLAALHAETEYFHIKDVCADTGELVPAGYGDGKIDKLVEMISSDKVLTLEPHLFIFGGYSRIDNTVMKNKFTFKSNAEAFDAAVNALKKILESAGYYKVKNRIGAYEKI